MVLSGVQIYGCNGIFNVEIEGTQIVSVSNESAGIQQPLRLNLDNALAFPGLINSHDHLEFNLFPQFGEKVYANYVEWGEYIHTHYTEAINAVLNIPLALRLQWGVYKNMLCGVTTVIHHGKPVAMNDPLITVVDQLQNLHSVRLESRLRLKLNNPLKIKIPVVIHTGEGTDEQTTSEIDQLINRNLLNRKIIGVHGVAMSERQARHFKALVWCPQSNYFLLNKTAAINKLKNEVPILFGTDSTITSHWNIWEHIRTAREAAMLTDDELYQSLTTTPANIWKQNSGEISAGKNADIVIIKSCENNADSLFYVKPEDILMVMHQGQIRLFDESLLDQIEGLQLPGFSRIYVNNVCKYIEGDLSRLMKNIRHYYPEMDFPVQTEQYLAAN